MIAHFYILESENASYNRLEKKKTVIKIQLFHMMFIKVGPALGIDEWDKIALLLINILT